MAETRSSKSKGKKLDSIISKLKINPTQEAIDTPNESSKPVAVSLKETEKIENVDASERRKSKRKSQKILRYRIGDGENDEQTADTKETVQHDDKEKDVNDIQLPEAIFEELTNGDNATFEEGEDTTVLFLPAEEIQVKAGTPDDYLVNLLDGEGSHHEEDTGEEKQNEKKKKKKKKHHESDESLDEDGLPRRVICTACGRKVNPSHGTILRHPILNVLVCKKCNRYYNSGPFTRDEFGMEEQCRWCGDGGDLICCDICEKVFCKPCIQRNCGKTYLKNLLNAPDDFKWFCVACNKDKPSKHIQRLRKKCEEVMEALEHVKEQKAHFKSKKGKEPSVVSGPTTSERRRELNCLSEGIKSEGFSSGESPMKKNLNKDTELPAKLFSKSEDEKELNEENKSETKSGNEQEENGTVEEEEEVDEKEDQEECPKTSKTSTSKERLELENKSSRNDKSSKSDSEKDSIKEKETEEVQESHRGEITKKDVGKEDPVETESGDKVTEKDEDTEELRSADSGKVKSTKTPQKSGKDNQDVDTGKEEDEGEVRVTCSGETMEKNNYDVPHKSGKDEVKGTESDKSDKESDKEEEVRVTRSGKVTGKTKSKETLQKSVKDHSKETKTSQETDKEQVEKIDSKDEETDKEEDVEGKVTHSRKASGKNAKDISKKIDKDQIIENESKETVNRQEEDGLEVPSDDHSEEDEKAAKNRRFSLRSQRNNKVDVQSKKSQEKKKSKESEPMVEEMELENKEEKELEDKEHHEIQKKNSNKKLNLENNSDENVKSSKTEIEKNTSEKEDFEEVRLTRSGKAIGKKATKTTIQSDKDEITSEEEDIAEIRVTRSGKTIGRRKETSQENDSSHKNSNKVNRQLEIVIEKLKYETDEPCSSDGNTRSSRTKANKEKKQLKKQDDTKKNKTSLPKVIVLDSSEASSENEALNNKEIQSKKNKQGKKGKSKKVGSKVVEEKNISSSDTSDSDLKIKKGRKKSLETKKKGKTSSKKDLTVKEENDSPESSDMDKISLKNKPAKNTGKSLPSMSSDSDFQTKKVSKKKALNKKELKSDSSVSEEDLKSILKRKKSKVEVNNYSLEESDSDEEHTPVAKSKNVKDVNEYSLEESSESDENSSDTDQDSDEESDIKTKTQRGRGLQKQTRKRPRPVTSSSNSTESSEKSSDDEQVARRTRKRKVIGSDSSDDKKSKHKSSATKRLKKTRKIPKGKKGKKRKAALDSDDENESDEKDATDSESEPEQNSKKKTSNKGKKTKTKKKRSRIRENTDSEEEKKSTPSKGRKKIRQQLTDEKLEEETRKARRLEEERRKRLLERTRIAEKDEMPTESWHMKTVVLEKDKDGKEPLVEIKSDLVQHLKPHQAKGIQFMYNNVVDSIEAYKKGDKGGGCILAHCMGLGKTLQVVSLIHTLHNHKDLDFKTTLVIAPLNTVLNWEVEFDKWLSVDERMEVFVLKEAGHNNWRRADMLKQWQRYGGVMILGYDMYRNLSLCNRIRSKHQKKIFTESLVDPGPDLVVCDEGHILRNDQSAISKAVNSMKTKRRIVLTGTPLQNNLIEYHCMVSFIKPSLLGTRKEFMNMFGNPIMNGQCVDSSPLDVKIMKQSCHVLYKLLEGCVQRRDYNVLTPFLPPKHEYVIKIRLSEIQRKLYSHYLNTFVYLDGSLDRRGASLFSDYQALMRIWTHPWCLKLEAIRRSLRAPYSDSDNSLDGFVVHTDEEEESEAVSSSDEISISSDESLPKKLGNRSKNNKNGEVFELKSSSDEESGNDNTSDEEVMPQPSQRLTRSNGPIKVDEPEEDGEQGDGKSSGSNVTRSGASFKEDQQEEKEWYDEFLSAEDEYNVELSGKMALLLEILADAEAVDEKVLVFSQSLVTLDLIERALGGGEVGGDRENWCKGCDYFRMDGSTGVQLRQRWADIFNDVDNKTARLFLISTKAGGLGINLVAANRVVVFDVSWNPSHDVQSIFRVYRFGQTKPVYVYRLVTEGVMEERIYDRQIAKLSTSQRVIDKHQIERHFTAKDLAELYRFTPSTYDEEKDQENTTTLPLPKDAVLADLINRMHPKWIVNYHEHDSLLQNVQAEQLTEEECKQAWAAYEAQKNQEKNNMNMRALQAQYAQQQLQQQQQAIPSQNTVRYSNVVLHEMQQLQRQQLSERMARLQAPMQQQQQQQQQQQNQQYLASIRAKTVAEQIRQERMQRELLQHLGAARPIYRTPGPGSAPYQPMMTYISLQQQQAQQLLRQPQPNQPQQTTVVPVIHPGTVPASQPQYRHL